MVEWRLEWILRNFFEVETWDCTWVYGLHVFSGLVIKILAIAIFKITSNARKYEHFPIHERVSQREIISKSFKRAESTFTFQKVWANSEQLQCYIIWDVNVSLLLKPNHTLKWIQLKCTWNRGGPKEHLQELRNKPSLDMSVRPSLKSPHNSQPLCIKSGFMLVLKGFSS